MTLSESPVQFATRADGVRLAFRHVRGRGPTLVFLPGYKSDMQGGKAQALGAWAADQGVGMLRLDYSGCGESEGAFEDGTLDIWRDDVLTVIAQADIGPLILIGSSMGGWLMLLVAEALGKQVTAMVGIAAAPDFTDWDFDAADRATIAATGRIERPSDYGYEPMVITQGFWQSGQSNLRLTHIVEIDCPVRLIHGQCDPDVPWETSVKLAQLLRSSDVQTILLKDGDHRLSRDHDIALLIDTVAKLPC
ncbi:MAG: alpha/beta hydrolase [Sphingomonadaceae bacterium]|uniref:alpha/beta hydrolase n=1 Tax=Sphingorhabdus sp. TaxID=1902408 RepID=UPI0037CC489F|nr:alpha/beta hydrolase [Sphingomonadaceae bacterium]MCF8498037.1 alpha/beta hydrolase [Sphingomonadaceae bacterium]